MLRHTLASSALASLALLVFIRPAPAAQTLIAEESWNFLHVGAPFRLTHGLDVVGATIRVSGASGTADIRVISLYGQDDFGHVVLRREQAFDAFVAMLTNGQDDALTGFVNASFVSGVPAALGSESGAFAGSTRIGGAPDLAGYEIETIEFTARNHFDSPGQDPAGDSYWTDAWFDASLRVFGTPVATPAPDLMGSLRLSFGGLGLSTRDPVTGVVGFAVGTDAFTLPAMMLEAGGEDASIVLSSGADFDRLAAFFSDGADGRLALGLGGACCVEVNESGAVAGPMAGFDGTDFAGASISRIEILWRNLLDSPGLDPNGDGRWTDVEARVTVNVYGTVAAVPEPATALQVVAGMAVMGALLAVRRRRAAPDQCDPKLS